jgi:hypothetical protein
VPYALPHRAFVLDSFRRELLEVAPWTRELVAAHVEALDRELRHVASEVTVRVAVLPGSDDIVGWAAARRGVLLFAYVKLVARERGIAAALVDAVVGGEMPIRLAYWTSAARGSGWLVYDPSAMLITRKDT